MAGMKPAMIIQSTGIGNILNTVASLTLTYEFPLLIIASWRGVIDEPIAAQNIFGEAVENLLKALHIETLIVDENPDLEVIKEKVTLISFSQAWPTFGNEPFFIFYFFS